MSYFVTILRISLFGFSTLSFFTQNKFYIQDYCAWAYFSAVGATFPVPIALTAAIR